MHKENTLLWIIGWALISIVCASTMTTAGSIAAIIAAVFAGGTAIYAIIRGYGNRSPWRMDFTFDLSDRPSLDSFSQVLRIEKGRYTVRLKLTAKRPTILSRANIRPVIVRWEPHLWGLRKRENFPNCPLKILDVRSIQREMELEGITFCAQIDGEGGYDLFYRPEYPVTQELCFWLELDIEATADWTGELSFRGELQGIRRFARGRVEIK